MNHSPAEKASPDLIDDDWAEMSSMSDRQVDIFRANLLGLPVKDDLATMEFPIYSVSKKSDGAVRWYEHRQSGKRVRVAPSADGAATIFDKDLLLFIGSQIVAARDQGLPVSRVVVVDISTFFRATGKRTSGGYYSRVLPMLRRLKGTQIETNIATGGKVQIEGFGLIEDYKITRTGNGKVKSVLEVEVTLSNWVYNAFMHVEVLTVAPAYFELTEGITRRLYELGRKHCGSKAFWRCGIQIVWEKTGSSQGIRQYRQQIRRILKEDRMPEYRLALDNSGPQQQVVFYTRNDAALMKALAAQGLLEWFSGLERVDVSALPTLTSDEPYED